MAKRYIAVTPSPRKRMRMSRTGAARKIQKAWRAKRRNATPRRTRMIGSSIWRGTCKSTLTADQDATARTDNTQWSQEITDCSQGSEMNQRERGIINCRGFKIDYFFQNLLANSALYVNMAVVAPKQLSTDNNAVQLGQFFRSAGNNRALDFNAPGTVPFERHILGINPDEYHILKHKRFILAAAAASTGEWGGNRSSFRHVKMYIKMNRAVTYQAAESASATDGKVGIVYWFGQVGSTDGTTTSAACNVSDRVVMYFKEPKQ